MKYDTIENGKFIKLPPFNFLFFTFHLLPSLQHRLLFNYKLPEQFFS